MGIIENLLGKKTRKYDYLKKSINSYMTRLLQVINDLDEINELYQKELYDLHSDKFDINDIEAVEKSMENFISLGFTAFNLFTEQKSLLNILEYKINIVIKHKLVDKVKIEKIRTYVETFKPINEQALKEFEKYKTGKSADLSKEIILEMLANRVYQKSREKLKLDTP